jgi:hypothetical protein
MWPPTSSRRRRLTWYDPSTDSCTRKPPRAAKPTSRFFDDLGMVEPGVVRVQQWRSDTETEATTPSNMWGGVGRKG